ncbi:hypothetical protein HPB48_022238 [Haemaphysalis longicornis]|uniref:Uncharacterized protein n=1 Tax=Haemaphysalis longicornis TaxID=44386 RepID=A0A9J6GJD6_HAELO|nr:hypothetical protein HPB48_022238 [Haemaphysalis longicornis]
MWFQDGEGRASSRCREPSHGTSAQTLRMPGRFSRPTFGAALERYHGSDTSQASPKKGPSSACNSCEDAADRSDSAAVLSDPGADSLDLSDDDDSGSNGEHSIDTGGAG